MRTRKSKPIPYSKFTRKQQEILNWLWATRSDESKKEAPCP
jgi:hypothetical protein